MCCCCGLRGTTICASIFTLVQSLLGIAFSVFILVNSNRCISSIPRDNTLYYFYFYRPECFPSSSVLANTQFNFVARTLIWGKVYLALNSCWLISSFLMTVCSSVNNPKKTATYLLYSPWIIVTVAVAVTDVAASIIHFSDLTNLQVLLDIANSSQIWWNILIGPLVMGLLFSRCIIGWIINFGMLICVSVAVVQFWKSNEGKVLSTLPHNRQTDNRYQPGAPPMEEQDWNSGYIPHIVERTKPGRQDGNVYSNNTAVPNDNTKPVGNHRLEDSYTNHYRGPNVQGILIKQPKVILPDPRYREAYANREEEVPRKAPKGYIPASPDPLEDEKHDKHSIEQLAGVKQKAGYPTGVRNQLPWSYFQNPAEPRHPVPKQPDVEDDLDRPPVPVPDYTLHIGKRPMNGSRQLSRSNSDASSSNNGPSTRPSKDNSHQHISQRRSSREADVLY